MEIKQKFVRQVYQVFTVDFGKSWFEVNIILYFGYIGIQFKNRSDEFNKCLLLILIKADFR